MRILVAIDDSKSLEELLRAIIMQIRTQDSEVRILHVLQPISVSTPPQMARSFTPEIEEQKKQAQELIDTATKQIASAGFKVDSVIDKGDVKETILDSAIQWHADLIVVGSHGSGGVRRFLLGSVAESVARHAPCSVEIVRIPRRLP
jgi:nucleotide-binding universal stress UspA family protein